MLGIIYCYTSPSGKKYIGQTTDKDRLSKHLYLCNKGVDLPFYRAIRKYGIENFKYEVLFNIENDDIKIVKKVLSEKEIYFILLFDSFKNGYNCSEGGEGNLGFKHSENTKNILSEHAYKQWENEEFKNYIINIHKGKILSSETKDKISKHSKLMWENEEYVKKVISHKYKKVKCIETDKIYSSVKECSDNMNINKNNISQVCRGERKHTKGYSFIYI